MCGASEDLLSWTRNDGSGTVFTATRDHRWHVSRDLWVDGDPHTGGGAHVLVCPPPNVGGEVALWPPKEACRPPKAGDRHSVPASIDTIRAATWRARFSIFCFVVGSWSVATHHNYYPHDASHFRPGKAPAGCHLRLLSVCVLVLRLRSRCIRWHPRKSTLESPVQQTAACHRRYHRQLLLLGRTHGMCDQLCHW